MCYLEICYQVFVATMACHFIDVEEELIKLLKTKVKTKPQNGAQTTGNVFLKSGQDLGGTRNS